jgi:hypothetical protein
MNFIQRNHNCSLEMLSPEIENITTLVRNKALPHSDGCIVREEILKYFGVTSEHDLYPAPPEFEKLENVIHRVQHETVLNSIFNTKNPLIIHDPGGVGKTVFARHIVQSLPVGSFGIGYDCNMEFNLRNDSKVSESKYVMHICPHCKMHQGDNYVVEDNKQETELINK